MNEDIFILNLDPSLPSEIAILYAQMEEERKWLLEIISKIDDDALDFTPDDKSIETIGTLLLHIAAVEWSWIFQDIDKKDMDEEKWKYAFPLRKEVNIPQLKGKGKNYYIRKLDEVRMEIYDRLKQFRESDFKELVVSEGAKFSIQWILHHLIEHEGMHIGQILLLKRLHIISEKKVI